MGAWGPGVMENDTALDLMGALEDKRDKEMFIREIFKHAKYTSSKLWAIEMIDISLNGVDEAILGSCYEYEETFELLTTRPMQDLVEEALEAALVTYWIEESMEWGTKEMTEERKEILRKIAKRLYRFASSRWEEDVREIGVEL